MSQWPHNAFTTSTDDAPTAEDIRKIVKSFLAKFGPPKCLVVLPNGDVYSGTIKEMAVMLQRHAFAESRLYMPLEGGGA